MDTNMEMCLDESNIEAVTQIQASQNGDVYFLEVGNQNIFNKWILSLKLRYWIDFGNREDYNIEWLKKLITNGELVEILIKLSKYNANEDQDELLFSITILVSEKKLMIEGKYHNLWRENEHTKLQSLVSELCVHDELEQHIVEQLFKKIFYQDLPDYEINLDKVSLDIYAESDTEDNNLQECDDAIIEENKSSAKIKSPRIARRKTCASLLTPLKKKSGKIQPPKTTSPDMQTHVSQQQMLDLLNSCNKRIDDLEKIMAKL